MNEIDHKSKLAFFRNSLLRWFKTSGRLYPWRNSSASLYEKIIAELLLQRTKADVVNEFFGNFIRKFPSWEAIANSTKEEIGDFIKPLGLWNQRAESLHKLSHILIQNNGCIPLERDELEKLPGVGQYIASAILLFYKNQPEPLLDMNMQRLLERFFGPRKLVDIRYDPYLQKLSREAISCSKPVDINFAILDFAALVCKKKPNCDECILISKCLQYGI